MFGLGLGEMAVVACVALLVLGPDRLPEMGRKLGKLYRQLNQIKDDVQSQWHSAMAEDPKKKS